MRGRRHTLLILVVFIFSAIVLTIAVLASRRWREGRCAQRSEAEQYVDGDCQTSIDGTCYITTAVVNTAVSVKTGKILAMAETNRSQVAAASRADAIRDASWDAIQAEVKNAALAAEAVSAAAWTFQGGRDTAQDKMAAQTKADVMKAQLLTEAAAVARTAQGARDAENARVIRDAQSEQAAAALRATDAATAAEAARQINTSAAASVAASIASKIAEYNSYL